MLNSLPPFEGLYREYFRSASCLLAFRRAYITVTSLFLTHHIPDASGHRHRWVTDRVIHNSAPVPDVQIRTQFKAVFGIASNHVTRTMMQVYFHAPQTMMRHVRRTFAHSAYHLRVLHRHRLQALSSPCVFNRVLYLIF